MCALAKGRYCLTAKIPFGVDISGGSVIIKTTHE